jgi:hypothetical protein
MKDWIQALAIIYITVLLTIPCVPTYLLLFEDWREARRKAAQKAAAEAAAEGAAAPQA